MGLPFFIFWVLIFLGRSELGWRGAGIAVGIWLGLLIGFVASGLSPYLFVSAQALLDCILILVVFHGDIRIR
jgi:hypothetical protein